MEKTKKYPKELVNVMVCNNPKCVTTIEKYVPQEFYLVDENKGVYGCRYCDHTQVYEEKQN